jgi:hypothetical protein
VAELGQSGALVVEPVQLRERVHERLGDGAPVRGRERGRRGATADDHAPDPLHEKERRADHGRVVAAREWARGLRVYGSQGGQDPMLAAHVVSAPDGRPPRGTAQHHLPAALPDEVGEVGEAARELLDRDVAGQIGKRAGEVRVEGGGIDLLARPHLAGPVDGRLRAHQISMSTP